MKGTVVGTLDGFEAAVQPGEDLQIALVGFAESGDVRRQRPLPEPGFESAVAAKLPLSGDERIDEEAFQRVGGLELEVVIVSQLLEFGEDFAGDDQGLGLNARFQGIEGRDGLALDGAGAGGRGRIAPVG
ncbi:MAG: hypothetical protein LAP40_16500 [Acidobacteriia bacterium]|nr:hypothetical protein [Terriglobia bacterium]